MAYDLDKERREAIQAGERALDSLYSAQRELNSARGWGIWDILGGGFISGLIKHSKMNNAAEYMEQAKENLRSFSEELRDVSRIIQFDFNTSDFLSFADFFFDGFIADWLVQDRINNARYQVGEAIERVQAILEKLKANDW